jgi:hypothetical protein
VQFSDKINCVTYLVGYILEYESGDLQRGETSSQNGDTNTFFANDRATAYKRLFGLTSQITMKLHYTKTGPFSVLLPLPSEWVENNTGVPPIFAEVLFV